MKDKVVERLKTENREHQYSINDLKHKKEKPGRPAVSSVDQSIKITIYKLLLMKCHHMLRTKKILFKNF